MKLLGTLSDQAAVLHRTALDGAMECRFTWRTDVACERTNLTDGWKLLEQGPESQSASAVCCGGVSAVISASDLDGPTLRWMAWLAYPCKGLMIYGQHAMSTNFARTKVAGTVADH